MTLFGQGDRKYEKTMERASAFYDHYSYHKAIDLFEEALEIKDVQEPKVQLANCYRELNNPEEALAWYQKALIDGPLQEEDMLHYGQVLSALQQYDSAHAVLDKYQHREEWIGIRAEGFRNVDKFFHNELAYTIADAGFNSKESDFAPSITEHGVAFVTGRLSPGMFKPKYNMDRSYFLDLFLANEGEEPVKFERGINTRYHEGPSTFYENDKKVIFTRNNYLQHKAGESEEGVNHLKLFFSNMDEDGNWSKPQPFKYNSDEYSVGHPSISADEKTLYFASDMPGGFGGVDIYVTKWTGDAWSEPVNMGSKINTPRDEMFPYVSKNDFLYFSSDGHEGMGGQDIFRVDLLRKDGVPRNMGFSLNSNKDDFGIALNEEGNKGYFSSNRDGGMGSDDIYEVFIYDFIIKVNLRDANTKELIVGSLDSFDPYREEFVRDEDSISSIKFPAILGDAFNIHGEAPEYVADSMAIETDANARDLRFMEFDLYLKPKESGRAIVYRVEMNGIWKQVMYNMDSTLQFYGGTFETLQEDFSQRNVAIDTVIDLRNVLYDFDKHNITIEGQKVLDDWVSFLAKYPNHQISLTSHTDIRGSLAYNKRLAERRVKSAKKYLLSKGVDESRLKGSSHGEEQLFIDCQNDCDDTQHQSNRRTEILVIKL